MQAQNINTSVQSITVSQSLAAVQTLLKAGLGCITYLRDLLPVDNFNESHFTSSSDDSLPAPSIDTDAPVAIKMRRNVSAFKIMTVTRGFTEEADKLLNYLEYGIFDALKNQYLRSFIFAIYLDNKDPNNIVEAYTFNFKYHTVPGTDTVVPIMSFNEDSANMSSRKPDPITEAAKSGRPPTLGEVKKSVKSPPHKTLLRRLVNATTQMDSLPKRRYATFKLFYNDNTPVDYEPPHFLPGDSTKDRWFFTTHDRGEAPEKWSVGKLETGHHGVNISITSVAGYLPSSTEDNNAAFAGITPRPQGFQSVVHSLTPAEEATLRSYQVDIQMKDAEERNVVWSVDGEDEDRDAEGESDEGYVMTADGTYEKVNSGVEVHAPIGLRNKDGCIEPLPVMVDANGENFHDEHGEALMNVDQVSEPEAHFGGVSETVPSRVGELNLKRTPDGPDLDQTQQIVSTQELECHSPPSTPRPVSTTAISIVDAFANINIAASAANGSNLAQSIHSSPSSRHSVDIATQMVKDMVMDGMEAVPEVEVDEILDMETQTLLPETTDEDSIKSFTPVGTKNAVEDIIHTQQSGLAHKNRNDTNDVIDNGLHCECGVSIEDECTFCEGGCGHWYHIWCMGFHSTRDKNIPLKFICFDCRVRADLNWDLIKVHLYPKMISKFKDLALFRRAIKIAEVYEPNNSARFAKLIGCDNVVARQLFKRLEVEGFIFSEIKTTDDLGILETCTRSGKGKGKGKGKQTKQRKNLQRTKYVFNQSSKRKSAYRDYFNPDHAVESQMLGLADLKSSFKTVRKNFTDQPVDDTVAEIAACLEMPPPPIPSEPNSQTQDETQSNLSLAAVTPEGDCGFKRKTITPDTGGRRPSKKIKISVGPAVDLGD